MSGDTGRPSSSEVAHEAEDTRANLASTLEQLRDNLRPENVVAEVVSNARVGVASVADTIAGVARQYPLAAVLMATGSALVMRVFAKRPETTGGAPEGAGGLSALRPTLLRNPSRFAPARSRDGVLGADGAFGAIAAQGAALRSRVRGADDAISSQAGDAMQTLSRSRPPGRGDAKSKLSNLLEEQPLILGAIGLAIGAAIGAALPITETEDNLMGGTAHRFRDTAADAARHEIDGLRAVASDAVGSVRHAAGDNLNGFVKDVGDSVKTAVDKAGDTLAARTPIA